MEGKFQKVSRVEQKLFNFLQIDIAKLNKKMVIENEFLIKFEKIKNAKTKDFLWESFLLRCK